MDAFLEPTVLPTKQDCEQAHELIQRLAPYRRRKLRVEIPTLGKEPELLPMPLAAVELLVQILSEMAAGNAVTLLPMRAELTTGQAADILNVSRPFLISLLENGTIPHRKVGSHRRIRADAVLAFKRSTHAAQEKAMDHLTRLTEEIPQY